MFHGTDHHEPPADLNIEPDYQQLWDELRDQDDEAAVERANRELAELTSPHPWAKAFLEYGKRLAALDPDIPITGTGTDEAKRQAREREGFVTWGIYGTHRISCPAAFDCNGECDCDGLLIFGDPMAPKPMGVILGRKS